MITKSQIKYIRGLSLKKNRMKEQCFIVEGEKSLSEVLDSSFEVVELFALKDWINDNKEVSEKVQAVNFKELERISNLRSPNKVLAVVKIKNYQTKLPMQTLTLREKEEINEYQKELAQWRIYA